ncbi:PIN domain-containing protein [Thermus scotoductus]|uniref:PIN domain-containing protein n=1 Tax=Thermus scotoductus TaxID=37636 RepID=UPI0020A5706F|nr:hypothetical protein [Thermus scotoductus]
MVSLCHALAYLEGYLGNRGIIAPPHPHFSLKRPKFRDYVSLEEVQDYLAFLIRWGEVVPDPPETPGLSPDPRDDYLVALARASRARVLVSGDRHLLGLAHPEPPVLSPRAFLELLESLDP